MIVTTPIIYDVQVYDGYKHSLIITWKTGTAARSIPLGGYYVSWSAACCKEPHGKWVRAESAIPNRVQIQPLATGAPVDIQIYPVDPYGKAGTPATITGVSAKGTYEAGLEALTRKGGFLYLSEKDEPMMRPDPTRLHVDNYQMNVWPEGTKRDFGHSCVAMNDQFHWHMIGADSGTGSITCRLQQPMILDGQTRRLRWDCDKGPVGRQAWYVVLSPQKVDRFRLFPNNNDLKTTGIDPPEQIRMRITGSTVDVRSYAGGTQVGAARLNWRGNVYPNVRQQMGLDVSASSITFLADTEYNGNLQTRGSFPVDIRSWRKCYVYFTFGSYNNKKTNDIHGLTASGTQVKQFSLGIMHWGNIAFDGPTASEPVSIAPSHPIFDTMPDHYTLKGWAIPSTYLSYPGVAESVPVVRGALPITVRANSSLSAHIVGDIVPIKRVSIRLDGNEIWAENTDASGIGTPDYTGRMTLDTTRYANGYHLLTVHAVTASGSEGFNTGDAPYRMNWNRRILIYNAPPSDTVPLFEKIVHQNLTTGRLSTITDGSVFEVARPQKIRTLFEVKSATPLTSVVLYRLGSKGVWERQKVFDAGVAPQRATAGGTIWSFNWDEQLWSWVWFPPDGLKRFWLVIRDANAKTLEVRFAWQLLPPPGSTDSVTAPEGPPDEVDTDP